MHCVRPVAENLFWVGASERHHPLFESAHPVPQGMSYDSYLLLDEKTVLLDTIDQSVQGQFFENVEHLLNGRPLDYVVVHHMEPDHAAALGELLARHPETTVVCSGMAVNMIRQFHRVTPTKLLPVKEGDTLCAGRHTFTFVAAPMVHWPEVLVSYESTEKILFSADAFGTFGALDGVLFADEVDFDRDCIDEARRYYTNIVGKYGPQVTALLKKAAGLDIRMICPLHGPVWRKDLGYILDKYQKWAAYEPEVQGVMIAFASVYGGTETAAAILAARLRENGVPVAMYDVSVTHPSYVLSEAFKYSHLVFASTTYNNGIFVTMETLLHDICAHCLKNRTVALIQNGAGQRQAHAEPAGEAGGLPHSGRHGHPEVRPGPRPGEGTGGAGPDPCGRHPRGKSGGKGGERPPEGLCLHRVRLYLRGGYPARGLCVPHLPPSRLRLQALGVRPADRRKVDMPLF